MTDILNLDELVVTRSVTLKGTKRQLRGMTVDEFINNKDFQDKIKTVDVTEGTGMLVDEILRYMSDTTRDELGALTMEQLQALLAFVRGDKAVPGATAVPAAEGNEKPKSS